MLRRVTDRITDQYVAASQLFFKLVKPILVLCWFNYRSHINSLVSDFYFIFTTDEQRNSGQLFQNFRIMRPGLCPTVRKSTHGTPQMFQDLLRTGQLSPFSACLRQVRACQTLERRRGKGSGIPNRVCWKKCPWPEGNSSNPAQRKTKESALRRPRKFAKNSSLANLNFARQSAHWAWVAATPA